MNSNLIGLNDDDASFLQRHFNTIATLTSVGDKIFGVLGDGEERYYSTIKNTLEKIEALYQNEYLMHGKLKGVQFFAERNRLFTELKRPVNIPVANSLIRNTIKIGHYGEMRHALKLSSRSIVNQFSSLGVGNIKGYSTYLRLC